MENNAVKEIIIDAEKNFSIEANFLVLACGGIENSRLLLWFREHNKNISKNFLLEITGWNTRSKKLVLV